MSATQVGGMLPNVGALHISLSGNQHRVSPTSILLGYKIGGKAKIKNKKRERIWNNLSGGV